MADHQPQPIEGPHTDPQGRPQLGVWADEPSVLLVVRRETPSSATFWPLQLDGTPVTHATVSSFRWERIRDFLAPPPPDTPTPEHTDAVLRAAVRLADTPAARDEEWVGADLTQAIRDLSDAVEDYRQGP